jgi:hypothetical protein
MTAWTPQTEGHMILVEVHRPGQRMAWFYEAPDLLEPLGKACLRRPVT